MGLIAGLLMASRKTQSSTLHSDHLNSVRLIQDLRSKVGQENKLRSMNGRSYYRWIADLARRTRTSVVHVKSHTDEMGIGSRLNAEADHYASRAQNVTHLIPAAPIPTFFMEDYAFYRDHDGWIELDPTNNVWVGVGHVAVAWGRDFGDVSPLRGIILGGGSHKLSVNVTVEPVSAVV